MISKENNNFVLIKHFQWIRIVELVQKKRRNGSQGIAEHSSIGSLLKSLSSHLSFLNHEMRSLSKMLSKDPMCNCSRKELPGINKLNLITLILMVKTFLSKYTYLCTTLPLTFLENWIYIKLHNACVYVL